MLTHEFLSEFKRSTETKWRDHTINPKIYGFQFQPGTRWKPGLSEEEIAAYEVIVGIRFPRDFHSFLRIMNGTDLSTLNIYGSSNEPARESVGVYSYPRDLKLIEDRIAYLKENVDRGALAATMTEQGFDLPVEARLMPIYAHRYVVCTEDLDKCSILSIWEKDDTIVYGESLQKYLEAEFLQ
jgi:hypothetical protein